MIYYNPTYTLIAGDDKTIIVPVRDNTNQLIDLTELKNIIVSLDFKNVNFGTFRLFNSVIDNPVSSGVIRLTVNRGEIEFDLSNELTKLFVNGYYDVNITTIKDKNIWTSLFDYKVGDIVFNVDKYYICTLDHTSDIDFNTDILNWTVYTNSVPVLKTNYVIKNYLFVNEYGVNKTII